MVKMAKAIAIEIYDDLARDLNRVEKERDRLRKKNKNKTVIITQLREDEVNLKASITLLKTLIRYYERD